jgi:hypothetical protein
MGIGLELKVLWIGTNELVGNALVGLLVYGLARLAMLFSWGVLFFDSNGCVFAFILAFILSFILIFTVDSLDYYG